MLLLQHTNDKNVKFAIINLVFHPVWIITDISAMLLKNCYEPNHICTFQTPPPPPPFSLIRSIHFISFLPLIEGKDDEDDGSELM